jgi:helicase MOV-10
MERLMELPIYQKDPITKKYNPKLITKLIRSFRSHPRIIEFSNKTFYDGDLVAKGAPELTHWAINWRHLPKNNFPVIFVPCYGMSKKDDITCSTYNDAQIMIVIKYIRTMLKAGINRRKIEQNHIGIISPYKKQCLKIAQVCRGHKWRDIEVGTVETFQGREKPIIIVSTVKSGTDNVGFLDNFKVRKGMQLFLVGLINIFLVFQRLNVTITRAKALMIIIGNPETLKFDPYWHDLMAYCQSYGGCTSKFRIGPRPPKSYVVRSKMTDFNYHTTLQAKNQDLNVEDFF